MHTENAVLIRADRDRLFQMAWRIEDWPRILPHYRDVTIDETSPDGRRRIVTMAAIRDGFPVPGARFPVRWRSVQTCDPERREVEFVHIEGVATGMYVLWTLTPDPDDAGLVRVAIRHDLRYPFATLNGWFARDLVGRVFIEHIAGRTLATIKQQAETRTT